MRLDTGEYRFCSLYQDHKSLLDKGDKVVSAGMIAINAWVWSRIGGKSESLNIGPAKDDEKNIVTLLATGIMPVN